VVGVQVFGADRDADATVETDLHRQFETMAPPHDRPIHHPRIAGVHLIRFFIRFLSLS